MSTLGDRLATLRDALAAAYPARVVTRSLLDFSVRPRDELAQGVYTLVASGERFETPVQRRFVDGVQRILLVGQLVVAEDASGESLEEAELTLRDEVVAFVGEPPATITGLALLGFRQSGQVEHPYGWALFELEWPGIPSPSAS